MWKRPLLFLLLKLKGYFVFVLSPVGPTFDEKKFFCRVSDYALSDGGNRFSQFGHFYTVLKRHFSVFGARPVSVSRWEKFCWQENYFVYGFISSRFFWVESFSVHNI